MSDGFVRVGRIRDLRPGRGRQYRLDGKPVAVFRTEDGWLAIGDTCPHMGTSLSDGTVHGGAVECPWHHWRFDLTTGRSTERDWACVATYEVRVVDGELYLKPPAPPEPEPEPAEDDDWSKYDPNLYLKR